MRHLVWIAVLAACGHSHHEPRATEPAAQSFTKWTATHEYFVEYPPFVVGEKSPLAAHVTKLVGHAAVKTGKLVAILTPKSGAPTQAIADTPARPGIFRPELTPTTPGPCTLTIQIEDGATRDHVTTECVVHAQGTKLPVDEEEPPGRITFLKETAWTTEFGTTPAEDRELIPTLRTTGEIRAMAGREARLTATAHGRVIVDAPIPVLGMEVKAGQVLARISPQVENAGDRVSLAAGVEEAQTQLAAAQNQLSRSERLWAARTIAEKQLEEARTAASLARTRLEAARGRLGQFDAGASGRNGRTTFQVRSPLAGTLVAIHVSSGQSVEDGELLFTVVDLNRIWLHADVFEPDIAKVESSTRASFRVDGYEKPIAIVPPDGRMVTIGQLVDEKTRTVPVIFELTNPEQRLRIGSFATVWIETGDPAKVLAIPETAIVDDAGRKVAYVQVEGESFERRLVSLGIRSGGWVQVTAGIEKGERVVSRGAYEIKLAASGGAVPEHGHAH
jgi:cobalt-zinc-cadmium efflux system membrane fusion protein